MLSPMEKYGCTQILDLLPDEDVFALVKLLTNNAIKIDSRSEAVSAILSFTDSAQELLNRKKINKAILIKYCWNVSIPVQNSSSKPLIVNDIINSWALTQSKKQSNVVRPGMLSQRGNYNESSAYQEAAVSLSHKQQVTFVQNVVNIGSVSQSQNQIVNMTNIGSLSDSDQTGAERFVKWFYEMLNACHPAMAKAGESFGPHHFWANAQLFLLMASSAKKEEENIVGDVNVAERLIAFPKNNSILFNPNVNSQGVNVRTSCHGAKVILVCGTLHSCNDCVGIFQQSFALVNNPFTPNSWKVKVTCLKMDQCTTSASPTLLQCQEIKAIEAHTMKALELSAPGSPTSG